MCISLGSYISVGPAPFLLCLCPSWHSLSASPFLFLPSLCPLNMCSLFWHWIISHWSNENRAVAVVWSAWKQAVILASQIVAKSRPPLKYVVYDRLLLNKGLGISLDNFVPYSRVLLAHFQEPHSPTVDETELIQYVLCWSANTQGRTLVTQFILLCLPLSTSTFSGDNQYKLEEEWTFAGWPLRKQVTRKWP